VLVALVALSGACPAKEPRMVKISGVVQACEVRDVSKRAGVKNPRIYMSVAVEQTDPAELKSQLRPIEQFIGEGAAAARALPVGTRVEIGTYYDAAHPVDRYDIYTLATK
jgi:hypothetical protein